MSSDLIGRVVLTFNKVNWEAVITNASKNVLVGLCHESNCIRQPPKSDTATASKTEIDISVLLR